MKTKLTKGILLILSLLCILCVPVTPVYAAQQGTDGSELQVVKAEQLEIQLGTSWSGVEFQLKTDAGVYPTAPSSRNGTACSAWRSAAAPGTF